MKILLACDRTGGHFFPALCFARSCGAEISFFVTSSYFRKILAKEGWRTVGGIIEIKNFFLRQIFRLGQALYVIAIFRPRIVIGFGGRETFFLICVAWLCGVEIRLYEPNRLSGKANRILSRFARKVYFGFPIPAPRPRRQWSGIPIRSDLRVLDKKTTKIKLGFDVNTPVILYAGGSQGSEFINETARRFICAAKADCGVIHVTGSKQFSYFSSFYDTIKKNIRVFDFCYSMELLYSCADVVVARAGALTVAETCFYRIPALFIPYPGAGNHQYANARFLYDNGACMIMEQKSFSFNRFLKAIVGLLGDERLRSVYRENMAKLKVAVSSEEFCDAFALKG